MNKFVVDGPYDYEETLDGPVFLYVVRSCDIDKLHGTLTWDSVVFPDASMRSSSQASDRTPMISRSKSRTAHVSTLSVVSDDILFELRNRGVEVEIINNPSPAVTCEA